MGAPHKDPLPYDPDLIVDREDEIQKVVNLVSDLAAGKPVSRRTVIFRGERGCGKTWLLRHLTEDAHTGSDDDPGGTGKRLKVDRVNSWYISLDPLSGDSPEEDVRVIISALRKQIGTWRGTPPAFSEVGSLVLKEFSDLGIREVRDRLQNHVLVLLLDHVYEVPSPLLQVLEDVLLAPLAVEPKMLIVMAGRGRGYAWKAPELRLRVHEYWLQGLGVAATEQPPPPTLMWKAGAINAVQTKATEEQLSKLRAKGHSIVKGPVEILPETLGHPLSNFLVATATSKGEIVATLLKGIPPEKLPMLRLACVLRFFDEPQINGLLAACRGDAEFMGIAGMQPREIIEALLKTHLVRYDTNLAAYVMDEVIRRPLEGDVQERLGDLWRRLHEAAWDMYCNWVSEYPQTEARDRLQAEADHHAKRLGRDACPESQAHEES